MDDDYVDDEAFLSDHHDGIEHLDSHGTDGVLISPHTVVVVVAAAVVSRLGYSVALLHIPRSYHSYIYYIYI